MRIASGVSSSGIEWIWLARVELSARRLDAKHVDARLALAVAPLLQAHRREAVLRDDACAKPADRRLVTVDLVDVGERPVRAGRENGNVEAVVGAHGGPWRVRAKGPR
jgi:hypothetical protein